MDINGAVDRLFAPAWRAGRAGAEAELIPVTDTARPRPVDPALLAAGFDAGFARAAAPSFEPGLNPYHSCAEVPLRLRTPRYLAMQQVFDETGPDGRRMMRLTASLQITIDLPPGRAGQEQWLVADLADPPLTAAFANSRAAQGRPAGTEGARTRIWQNVGLHRTGYDGRHPGLLDRVGAYAAFAAAPRFPVPQAERPSYHLSTLFPPVRPRGGYLEVRYLDMQPPERISEAVATVAALPYSAQARHDALDLLLPRAGDQQRAWTEAATGFSPEAGALLPIARTAHQADAPVLASGGVP